MNVSNRLSEDVKIVGNLFAKDDLFIDCELEGEISSQGNLTVGENAKLKGEIKASNIVVFGKIDGNIESKNRCELKESSVINGNVAASTLRVIEGSEFNGRANVTRNPKPQSSTELNKQQEQPAPQEPKDKPEDPAKK
jgi:cytoskeletal protein CcmA (bactofilin family)